MTDPNSSAFPSTMEHTEGLTKREYFAAMALQALVEELKDTDPAENNMRASTLAADAVLYAEKLIEQLSIKPPTHEH